MAYAGSTWALPILENLSVGGARLFAAVRTAATVHDSATVRLGLPRLGLQVQSGNDGPIDTTVTNADELRLSNSNLLVTITLTPAASTIGQTVTARMRVRNVGSTTLTGVTPSALAHVGDGRLTVTAGPAPGSLDLPPGAESLFTWSLQADSVGSSGCAAQRRAPTRSPDSR
jgi:hypothetical protein